MTLAEAAEAELKRSKGERAPFVHMSDEGAAICRVLERRLQAMSRRLTTVEKSCREDCA